MGVISEQTRKLADAHGGYWGEHPDYPASDWRREVSEDNTRHGYWEWVGNSLELAARQMPQTR